MAAGVLAIILVGLLAYLSNEYSLNYRSHAWNRALHLAEAAAEIAFGELNYQYYQANAGFQSARGWHMVNASTYSNAISGFTDSAGQVAGDVYVVVTGVGTINPVVKSVATCAAGTSSQPVRRAIQVTLMAASRFPVGFMSKNQMDMNGNYIYVDSYDSTDVAKSTGGLYDSAKKQSNGNVASDGTIINSLNIGNADIYGMAYTGVGGSVALGSSGSIGPTFDPSLRATTVDAGLSQGYIQSDFNVDVADVVLPNGATTWGGAPGATGSGLGSIIKDATLNSGSYRVNSVTLNSSAHGDVLTINGNVSLYVLGDVTVGGLGQIQINSNSSLTIYVGGNVSLAGNGIINNSAAPIKNQWYGLSSSTSWTVSGNGSWVGVIYAPEANVTMNGGGASGQMSGAVVANNITLNGQVRFHYDEALRASNTGAGYQVASWIELRNVAGAWVQ